MALVALELLSRDEEEEGKEEKRRGAGGEENDNNIIIIHSFGTPRRRSCRCCWSRRVGVGMDVPRRRLCWVVVESYVFVGEVGGEEVWRWEEVLLGGGRAPRWPVSRWREARAWIYLGFVEPPARMRWISARRGGA